MPTIRKQRAPRILSEEAIANMRAAQQRKLAEGKHNFHKGHAVPDEWREKLSVAHTGMKASDATREKMRLARVGKTFGPVSVTLHPHHILNFAEHQNLRFSVSNGITLCEIAHKEFHRIYGSSGNTKEQIMEFIGKEVSL